MLKCRGHFPSDEAATKLIYLTLRSITKKWKNPPVTWKLAATQFAIQFGEGFFATLAMVFKLGIEAQKHWRRLNGSALLPKVVTGVQFIDGEELEQQAA
jgi:hypothetical protein